MRKAALSALIVTALALVSLTTLAEAKLKIGDAAPEMKVAKWVKGSAVKEFEKGKVYVVEFWATWCGPCRTSIPHITEMAKKFKDKATFTGVSVFEKGEDIEKQVTDFVKGMGDKMDYNVALDDLSEVKAGWMAENWMEAAEQGGIPTAFVVGKDQKIAWIGHPMKMEQVVDEVVADKFDVKAAAEQQAKEEEEQAKAEAEQAKMASHFNKVAQLMQSGKNKEALAELNKVIAQNPQYEDRDQVVGFKFNLMLQADEAGAYTYARKLAEGKYKDNAMMLNQLAWTIVDDSGPIKLKKPDYATALMIAERAATASKNEDPMILDTLAVAYYKKGNVKKAIEVQEKAVKLLDGKKDIPQQIREEMTQRLAMFKKKKK